MYKSCPLEAIVNLKSLQKIFYCNAFYTKDFIWGFTSTRNVQQFFYLINVWKLLKF